MITYTCTNMIYAKPTPFYTECCDFIRYIPERSKVNSPDKNNAKCKQLKDETTVLSSLTSPLEEYNEPKH